MEEQKSVDESWKESAESAKELLEKAEEGQSEASEESQAREVNFLNYITSLSFQAMIFLGAVPNPVTNKTEKNLAQAKFLIDTLGMMKDKTKGNLTEQEENLLNASVYELQMKYVDVSKEEKPNAG